MAQLLRGTAFITGAASGIGQHTALSFARHGIRRLALADINAAGLEAANAALSARFPHVEILSLRLDVRDPRGVRDCVRRTADRFGRLDVAVNNAGIGGSGRPTHAVPESEWRGVLDVDLDGVWRCQREELAVMVEQEDLGVREGRGRIINVASMLGLIAPGVRQLPHTAYSAAKHGVIGMTRGDANHYGPKNIRINAICPGYVETPLLNKVLEDPSSPLRSDFDNTPLQRLAQMDEIGDAITFLASPMSSFVQGAALVADGGFSTQ
ncbi:uncharacterized protein E0L32_010817 [Thyridium curvatum]|uniref:Uncharacterized protein n=1 Tax=Thyridium curvatum TaxID=1093900 RepID=A0A507AIY3_9PEZI|nr:uncharacterized protein E0L32_010817 [Thyridium curvatum]TPX07223.1 hypothetical protein E0L32_010817 [Thyridium curvatum]